MATEVKEPEYNGVNVNHPSIIAGIQNMTRQGRPKEEIMQVIGVPGEVVERHQKAMERK